MATLWISEHAGWQDQVMVMPPLAEQTVTITGTSAQSAAFNAATRMVAISTDAACHILVGSNPTATTAKYRLPADGRLEFAVQGASQKIAVIAG